MNPASLLVAHRGEMTRACENTLPAFRAALTAGARYVELDVQFTRDGVPMVFHDAELRRLTGQDGSILDLDAPDLAKLYARHRRWRARIPRLDQIATLFNRHIDVTVFVELKRASIDRFGLTATVSGIAQALGKARFRWVLICFDVRAVEYARRHLDVPLGWVLGQYSDSYRPRADKLQPDYLFVDEKGLPEDRNFAWPGRWRWVIYDIGEWLKAARWFARGAHLIETGCVVDMLRRPISLACIR
jgi:glycerophosphoryl diester phosphodiesterase